MVAEVWEVWEAWAAWEVTKYARETVFIGPIYMPSILHSTALLSIVPVAYFIE